MIRGFLFDLDGTLVDSERQSGEAMARALLEGQNIAVEQSDRDYVVGRSWMAIYARIAERYPQLRWSREELISRTAILREDVFAEHGVTVLPGAAALIERTRSTPRAIVTGSSRVEVTQVLPLISEHAIFDVIVASEDVAHSKPSPDGYLKAIAQLGLAPHACLVLEDSVAGIAAGRAAGCLVVAVRAGNFAGWDQSGAHRIIETLDDLTPSLVDELAALDPRDYGSPMGSRP